MSEEPTELAPEPDAAALAEQWEAFAPGSRVAKGVYSIYKTPEGGMHLSYRPDEAEEDQHLPLPPQLLQMMFSAATGKGPLGRLGALAAKLHRG